MSSAVSHRFVVVTVVVVVVVVVECHHANVFRVGERAGVAVKRG